MPMNNIIGIEKQPSVSSGGRNPIANLIKSRCQGLNTSNEVEVRLSSKVDEDIEEILSQSS
jgi:hypothetical protein